MHVPTHGSGKNRDPALYSASCFQLYCATQVLEAKFTHQDISRHTDSMREALGNTEPEADWASLPLQQALPFLCKESKEFRQVLTELARSRGQHNFTCGQLHALPTRCKSAVKTASAFCE
jgi:hypothetical protein